MASGQPLCEALSRLGCAAVMEAAKGLGAEDVHVAVTVMADGLLSTISDKGLTGEVCCQALGYAANLIAQTHDVPVRFLQVATPEDGGGVG